jgi:hypothetical protein
VALRRKIKDKPFTSAINFSDGEIDKIKIASFDEAICFIGKIAFINSKRKNWL